VSLEAGRPDDNRDERKDRTACGIGPFRQVDPREFLPLPRLPELIGLPLRGSVRNLERGNRIPSKLTQHLGACEAQSEPEHAIVAEISRLRAALVVLRPGRGDVPGAAVLLKRDVIQPEGAVKLKV